MGRQLKLPMRIPTAQEVTPNPDVVHMAQDIAAGRGKNLNVKQFARLQQNPRLQHAIYQAYAKAEQTGESDTPELRASYDALARDVEHHYERMTAPREKGGLGFTVEVTKEDPYTGNSKEFMNALNADINRRHIKVLSTETTGGHNYFTNEQNDKLRAVHDLFGHIGSGRGFTRHGEEAAWRVHSQMVSPEALPALTSEFRGQTAYLIGSGDFPAQSENLIGLPKWASSLKEPNLAPRKKREKKAEQPQIPGIEW